MLFFYGNNILVSQSGHDDKIEKALNHCNCKLCNIYKIISWIDGAKKTLDVCLYIFNNEYLLKAVTNAQNRGVSVKIILNSSCLNTLWDLELIGVSIKLKNQRFNRMLMHHKFVIIDNKKVILGSLNWTNRATHLNWENIFITNELLIVDAYSHEFQRLWLEFGIMNKIQSRQNNQKNTNFKHLT